MTQFLCFATHLSLSIFPWPGNLGDSEAEKKGSVMGQIHLKS